MTPVSTRRILLGLLGAPIAHSASPSLHEAAAKSLGMLGYYHLIERSGLDRDGLRAMLDSVRRTGFAGINVTFPYKEAIVGLLDELSPRAAAMGAVNTVVIHAGRLCGHNTDTTGFASACREAPGLRLDRPVALMGAGGVGKAIAFALADLHVPELRILDFDAAKADVLAQALHGKINARAMASPAQALSGAGGLINATPIGMKPNVDSPVPVDLLRQDMWVADAVYAPLYTPLLLAARKLGATIMTGRELVIHQAADAFALFTGLEPSRALLGEVFDAFQDCQAPNRL